MGSGGGQIDIFNETQDSFFVITIIFIYHYVCEKVKGNGIGYIQEEADL